MTGGLGPCRLAVETLNRKGPIMADRFYPGHSSQVTPQAFGAGRQNDEQGAGTADIVLCADIEGYAHGSQITVPDERANWLVAEGFAAFANDYKQAFPDYVPVQIEQSDAHAALPPKPVTGEPSGATESPAAEPEAPEEPEVPEEPEP